MLRASSGLGNDPDMVLTGLTHFSDAQTLSCSLSKLHTGKGLKPLVTKLSEKSLCNLNSQQLMG